MSGNSGGTSVTDVRVPDIGDFSSVPVVEIYVAPGDMISEEDPILALESDKATMDVPSPATGKVAELLVGTGDTVSEGTLIIRLKVDEGEVVPAQGELAAQAAAARPEAPEPAPAGAPAALNPDRVQAQGVPANLMDFSDVHASPATRRLARELEIDLTKLSGSGAGGRITKADIRAAIAGTLAAAPAATGEAGSGIPPVPEVDFSKFGPVKTVEMSRIQRISGPALHRSWLNIPHVTHSDEADITELEPLRKSLDDEGKALATEDPEKGYRVTLLAFVIKACTLALEKHWQVNSSLAPGGRSLIRKDYRHIGFAADTPQGLVVPVIRDADKKGVLALSRELGALSAKARAGKLSAAEMSGASFTISSLGGIGGTAFTPIVNAPEAAILGVVRARQAGVYRKDADGRLSLQPRLMLPLCLSYDHRIIDGALAARFCVTLKALLEQPVRMVL